jgi:death-on-curing protein
MVEAMHLGQIREHGGRSGVRDAGALEAALHRARNKWHYGGERDLCALAAVYGYGIVTSHPFADGNKRTAFLSMYVFLGLNGRALDAEEVEVVLVMRGLAAGELADDELAAWLRDRTRREKEREGKD